jgi:hypothetical protein
MHWGRDLRSRLFSQNGRYVALAIFVTFERTGRIFINIKNFHYVGHQHPKWLTMVKQVITATFELVMNTLNTLITLNPFPGVQPLQAVHVIQSAHT